MEDDIFGEIINRNFPNYRGRNQNAGQQQGQRRYIPRNRPEPNNRPHQHDQAPQPPNQRRQNQPQPRNPRGHNRHDLQWRNRNVDHNDFGENDGNQQGHRQRYGAVHRNPRGHAAARDGQDDENRPNNEDGNHRRGRGHWQQNLGFRALDNIANSDPLDLLGKINEKRDAFLKLINQEVDDWDIHVLIIRILSKACLSSFEELKMRLLLEVCNSKYLKELQAYLMDLPNATNAEKRRNRIYWDDQDDFWKHLITFWEAIFNRVPSVALKKCRTLIEGSSRLCLEGLHQRHKFVLSEEHNTRLADLRDRLTIFANKYEQEEDQNQRPTRMVEDGEAEPPEDFRNVSVIPKREELLEQRPFVRANVVSGGYRSVDHYLDVQFRLLREDCFGPLRDGLYQYINDPKKKKYDNMRVYQNVKFIGPYVSNTKTGYMIQLDASSIKRLKRINWAHSKRFIFGSLLLFSKDNCNSFMTATIVDRETKYLSQGMIPVSIVDNENILTGENIIKSIDSYVMFESEVYFEPYLHVLKALQDPDFARHVAMKQYIVDVNVQPTQRPPQYLREDCIYTIETPESPETVFKVLEIDTWPSPEQLKLNMSQFEAYHLALTHEFAVIQGPPGTGKTYLGAKVARTLLENIRTSKCLMLVICYTNHALDQFLEHILAITPSVVRIGSQSKNKAMENISLNALRHEASKKRNAATNLYFSEKRNLKIIMGKLQTAQKQIESLSNGILTYHSMCEFVPDVQYHLRGLNVKNGQDKILTWLLQDRSNREFVVDIKPLLAGDAEDEYPMDIEDDANARTEHILDDLGNEITEIDINGIEVQTTFMCNDANQKMRQLIRHHKETMTREQKNALEDEMRELLYVITVFQVMKNRYQAQGVPRPAREAEVLTRLPNADRWAIYFTWANAAINKIREEIAPLQEEMNQASATYEEARMNLDLNMLAGTKVVGMTTSGAARLRKLLVALAPPIVIVEEAAEVLEQHIVTSLTHNCQHLILIGDHKQLRPSAASMRLARDYNIEVSLFERMILNQMHSRRLSVQHRMRPEISALIAPHIYTDLENHPSVEGFPKVRGITADMFFYTHDHTEDAVEDSASKSNHKEADMVLGLANYLMQQDYQPEDVTILAAYSGQMFYLRKQRAKYAFLNKVKITVVDNYQGEESKIILLSLVRNNSDGKIGFLGTENRICVALSRAKEGFYMFGNIHLLKEKSTLWAKIAKTLEDGGAVGTALILKCQNHPNQISTIKSVEDFNKVPEGGCGLLCNQNLRCGHPCPQICHGYDRGHKDIQCTLQCERIICELGHVCPLKCAVACEPCKVRVTKRLPCRHEMQVPCHREPTDPAVKCTTVVSVRLSVCGHEVKKPCHVDVGKFACPVPCAARVERCGHTCRRRCHAGDDPAHEQYVCVKECAQANKGCTADLIGDRGDHQCKKQCWEACDDCNVQVKKKRSSCKHSETVACSKDVDETPCRKKCARVLDCGHYCKKKCFEACGNCDQKVQKAIPECGHMVEVECSTEPSRSMCQSACERVLPCGHACRLRCDAECSPAACQQLAPEEFPAPCGHAVSLPCNVLRPLRGTQIPKSKWDTILLAHCRAPCTTMLECSHLCTGSCSACRQGRLHAPCTQPCNADIICGHRCEEPCNQVCPPCKKRCEVKCPHSKCNKLCGVPCTPCQEICSRKCPHGECVHRCGEPCSRAPCDEPCALRRPCGHACRGLCGEPCPDLCRLCSPDTFPKDDFITGEDYDDDAKFVKLQDCTHVMEVEAADTLMSGDQETITIRGCPYCRQPIINTGRYKDRVNHMYRAEINPIKEKVYGTPEQVNQKRDELKQVFDDLKNTQGKIKQENFKKAFNKIQTVVRTLSNKNSLLQLQMHFLYINIMDMIAEKIQEYQIYSCDELNGEFSMRIDMVCDVLVANINKISRQQQGDIGNEIKRMGSIIQLSKMFSHTAYKASKDTPKVVEAAKIAKSAVLSWKIYDENVVMAALKKLEDEIKVSGIVTKEEREMVVKAMGFKAGHWFKCPNGHLYCIGECGGAMQVSTCNECGAKIGGQSHRLLDTNAHAGEMDGSRMAAWPQEMNHMDAWRRDNL